MKQSHSFIDSQLRIASFQAGFPDPDGITTAVAGLSNGLAAAGHTVYVYGCGDPTHLSDLKLDNSVRQVITHRMGPNPFFIPKALLERIAVNTDNLDLLLIHGMFDPATITLARAARRAGIPYIAVPHGPYHHHLLRENRFKKALYSLFFERRFLRKAKAIQVFSPAQANNLRRYGVSSQTIILPNGIEPERIVATQDRKDFPGDPKIISLGRIDIYHKGLDLLVRAFARALSHGYVPKSACLHILGADFKGSRNSLEQLIQQLDLQAKVYVHDPVHGNDKWPVLDAADLFVLSSRYDGFALAVAEALLSSKPVLVSKEAGVSHWLQSGKCAFFVEPKEESICQGLREAIEHRAEWVEMGKNGRLVALTQFDWNQIALSATSSYRRVLAGASKT